MEEQIENIYPASLTRVSKGTLVLQSVPSNIMKIDPKPTAVKRTQEYNVKRVVLKDLNKNTQKRQGGCGNSNSVASTPVTCLDQILPVATETSECELPIQFTREFVEELVENVQCVGDKTASAVPHHAAEEASRLKLETQESLPGSLPDLLLPEAAFKKQSDTDTDTTEYESAAETDAPDGLSHSSSIVAEDSNVFEESAHGSAPIAEAQKKETLEAANILPCGDISILCADLDKLNLNSPLEKDFSVHSFKKLECESDSENSQAREIFCSGVVEVSSSSVDPEEGPHLNLSFEVATVTPELSESQKEQSLNEKDNLCSTSPPCSIVCNDSTINPHDSVENKAEHNSLETGAQIPCINEISVGIEDSDEHIPSGVEDNDQNLPTPPTIPGNDLSCSNIKVDVFECDEITTLESPVNITCLPLEETSISHIEECSTRSDLIPQPASFDAVTCSKELPKSDVDAISEVTEGQEHVISETPVSSEINTTYELEVCDDSRDPSKTSETYVPVYEYQDIESTVVELRSNLSNNSEEVSVPLLKGGGDCVEIDDKDYKLYENIIEISRLQEKDLEKECCDGSTIKKENYSTEGTDFGNLCCDQEELSESNEILVAEFGNISSEAEKVAEEIFNVSQEIKEEVSNGIVVDLKSDMEEHTYLNMDDRIDPFAPKSALRHSPPPIPRTNSPNSSSSRGSSPAKRHSIEKSSPKTRSKSGTSTPVKESSLSESDSPKSRSKASNSPNPLTKGNDANTEATHAKYCIEEREVIGSGAPIGAEMNNTTVMSVGTEDITYSQTNVSRENAAVKVSSGSPEQMLDPKRESLYVKFDPLWSAPNKGDNPLPQEDRISLERQEDGALQPERKEEDVESPGSNQALAYIDKLISLSPTVSRPDKSTEKIKDRNCSHISQSEISVPEKEIVKTVNKPEDKILWNNNRSTEVPQEAEMLNELQELRNMVLKQEQAYTEKVKILEKKIESLEIKLKEKDDKESKLNKKIAEMTEGQEQISIIMEEYERTIAGLVYEKEQEKQRFEQEKENLVKEKDTVSGHLENIEIAFSDVHRKYERSKDIIQGIKNNEETLRASLAEYEATIKQQEQKYDFLKSYATSQLESANQELESLRRSHQAESAKLHAMLKKAEIKASSLEEMLEQKIKENQELTAICDELIGKVGSSD